MGQRNLEAEGAALIAYMLMLVVASEAEHMMIVVLLTLAVALVQLAGHRHQ